MDSFCEIIKLQFFVNTLRYQSDIFRDGSPSNSAACHVHIIGIAKIIKVRTILAKRGEIIRKLKNSGRTPRF